MHTVQPTNPLSTNLNLAFMANPSNLKLNSFFVTTLEEPSTEDVKSIQNINLWRVLPFLDNGWFMYKGKKLWICTEVGMPKRIETESITGNLRKIIDSLDKRGYRPTLNEMLLGWESMLAETDLLGLYPLTYGVIAYYKPEDFNIYLARDAKRLAESSEQQLIREVK